MITYYIEITCDGTHCTEGVRIKTKYKMRCIDRIKKDGWAVSRNRDKFYCPKCAPCYTSIGCHGFPVMRRKY